MTISLFGVYYDEESGLYYLRARYYDPNVRRFISEDPVEDGGNWYVYAGNNPVMFIDPWGFRATLTGEKKYWQITFDELQTLTDDILTYDKQTGVITIKSYGQGAKVTGTQLVRRLIENNNFDLKIQRNGYDEEERKLGTQVIKASAKGATININDEWNNDPSAYILVANGDGTTSLQAAKDTPSFIFLGHELIHAYHHMNGTFNKKNGGLRYYTYEGKLFSEAMKSNQFNDEFETIGLGYIVSVPIMQGKSLNPRWVPSYYNSITENTLRQEHGLKARAAYTIIYK